MAVVDITIVHKRMAAALNAGPDDGTFAITSTDQGKFNADEVVASMHGGDSDVILLIQSSLKSGYRSSFTATSAELTYTGEVPPSLPGHPGEAGPPEIKLADNSWHPGDLAPSLNQLRWWRKFPSLFPSAEGHYFINGNKPEFIGQAIRFDLPVEYVADRVTPALKSPASYENAVLCASLARVAAKRGMDSELANFYGGQFVGIYGPLIAQGGQVLPDVQLFQRGKLS